MDLHKAFAVDEKKLTGGIWWVIESPTNFFAVEEAEIGDRTAVLLASMNSPAYRRALEKRQKPFLMRRGEIDAHTRDKIQADAMADAIVLNWKNFTIAGQTIPYSRQQAYDYLSDTQWVILRGLFYAMIGEEEKFKVSQEDDIVKNS